MPLPGVPVLPPAGLTDGAVRLRPLDLRDWPLLQDLSRDEMVVRWTTYPADLDETRALARITRGLAARERVALCVAELDGRAAGTCGAGLTETEGDIEIFYAVVQWACRQGVASSAASLLVSAAQAAGATSISLTTHLDNVASQVVAERAGFVALRQESRLVNGVLTDVQVWRWAAWHR